MHLVDDEVLQIILEDVKQDPAHHRHLEDPHEDLHQKPGDPRSCSPEFSIQQHENRMRIHNSAATNVEPLTLGHTATAVTVIQQQPLKGQDSLSSSTMGERPSNEPLVLPPSDDTEMSRQTWMYSTTLRIVQLADQHR